MIVWTIAGSDSGGGAGIQADLKTFEAHGVHGCSAVTLLTAQNTRGVQKTTLVDPAMLEAQIKALAEDLPPDAVKIGALGQGAAAKVVADQLKTINAPVVLDPVLNPSRGGDFAQDDLIPALREHLLPHVTLLTPNLPEAEALLQRPVRSEADIPAAAADLVELGAKSVLLKGGHSEAPNGPHVHDYWTDGVSHFWLTTPRLPGGSPHGTGCVLASAVTACLALGYDLSDALVAGRAFLNRAVREARAEGSGAAWAYPHHGVLKQKDMPVLTPTLIEAAMPFRFPSCGPEPLGFYPIVDRAAWLERILPLGVTTVQLRIKDLTGADLEREIKEAVRLCQTHGARLFVNDYWEQAIAAGAYGVHLGQEDLEVADLATIAGHGLRLGLSTHSHTEVARALAVRPSYAACGPIYETTTKKMRFGPQGLERLALWSQCLDLPLVAIGGISLERAPAVLATGVESIAVVSAVTKANDPKAAVLAWLNMFSSIATH